MNRLVIILVLAFCATAGGWATQSKEGGGSETVRTFDIVASGFRFNPATITVAQGERVRLHLRSSDRSHSFAIKAFRVKTMIPKGGGSVTVEFVADRAGTFDFTCAEYCGTGHSGMKGKLVVLGAAKGADSR